MKDNFNKLIIQMQNRINILMKINDLTLLQSELIAKNEFEKLNSNLENRRSLIDKLKDTNKLIKSEQNKVEEYVNNGGDGFADEVCSLKSLKNEAYIILKKISEADQKNELELKIKMRELKNEIKTINKNKKVFTVYNMVSPGVDSLYFDKNR